MVRNCGYHLNVLAKPRYRDPVLLAGRAEPALAIHAYQLHYGAYAPVGMFHVGQTVQAPGLEWATLKVADFED